MAYTSQEETITKSILNIKSLYNKKKSIKCNRQSYISIVEWNQERFVYPKDD